MRHYRLAQPEVRDGYKQIFINGIADFSQIMPSAICEKCNRINNGIRILPFECPQKYRKIAIFNKSHGVPVKTFNKIKNEIEKEINNSGTTSDQLFYPLRQGDHFQPIFISFPSRPQFDFLWPVLGCSIVSLRIKELFQRNNFSGVTFVPAPITFVGSLDSTFDIASLKKKCEEPEDIVKIVRREKRSDFYHNWFIMCVYGVSHAFDSIIDFQCPVCGFISFDSDRRDFNRLAVKTSYDVSILETTTWIIINRNVMESITSCDASNCELFPLDS